MRIMTNYSLPKNRQSFGNYGAVRHVQDFTNEVALSTIRKELSGRMDDLEAARWVKKVEKICTHTGIEPKRLPINSKHPGNLTKKENDWILKGIFYPYSTKAIKTFPSNNHP